MTRFKTSQLVASLLVTGTLVCSVIPAQAQPMMGDTGVHQDHEKMHKRMGQQWAKRQAELKGKLHLESSQEDAWNSFTQSMKPPAKPVWNFLDREELAKLTTPERINKMTAVHEANIAAIEREMKQRQEATRLFYSKLNADQQKIFDAETLPEQARMGWRHKGD